MSSSKRSEFGLAVGILVLMLLIFIVNLFHFNYRMNADIASDVILGELIWKSREIMPDTWYVANEARIICNPDLAALFYGMIKDMSLSAGLACCTMTIMIICSIFHFFKSSGINRKYGLMMALMCLAFPPNFISLELSYLFASYYAIHIVVLFLTLAVYAKYMKNKQIRPVGFLPGMILAFILGLQGVRGILVIYGPLFGIELIRNLYMAYQRQKRSLADVCLSVWTVLLLVLSFIGTYFPISVGQSFSRNIRNGAYKFLTVVIPDMGKAVGFGSGNIVGKACTVILLLLSLHMLIDILWRMLKKSVIEPIEWAYLAVCSSPVITALIVAFTTVESTERYYFILPFFMAFSVVLWWKKNENEWKKKGIGIVVALLIATNIFRIYLPVINTEEPPVTDAYKVTAYLEQNNYFTAYATFENANTMTVLSNGNVRVYPVATVEKMDICKWMASTQWYCPNMPYEEKTAYVITDSEEEEFKKFMVGKENSVSRVTEIGKYNVYVSDYNYSNLGEE